LQNLRIRSDKLLVRYRGSPQTPEEIVQAASLEVDDGRSRTAIRVGSLS
jgi:hypothetical protein